MNDLSNYIFETLEQTCARPVTLSENAISTLRLYENASGEKLLVLKTVNRNDEVFRKLNHYDCKGFLPQIYLVSSEDEALYVVEEYIEGAPLHTVTLNSRESAIRYTLDVCRALQILHSLGIVHRDVKPENIIVRPNGRATLIDLSIAKMAGDSEKADTVNLGTFGYAAPEQFGFMQSRPETDIYALGVTLNILLTGAHPMQSLPEGRVKKIIKKCTSLNINERYSDIGELIKDLKKEI